MHCEATRRHCALVVGLHEGGNGIVGLVLCRAWLAARHHQARLSVYGDPWSGQLDRVEKAVGGGDLRHAKGGLLLAGWVHARG